MTGRKLTLLSLGLLLTAGCQGTASSSDEAAGSGRADSSSRKAAAAERRRAAPTPAPLVIAAGTALPLELRTALSTASSRSGDLVMAVVREDVRENGRVVIPAGSELRGKVVTAVRGGKVKGRARLVFSFDEIEVRGRTHALAVGAVDLSAKDTSKKDAAIIGGGTAGGALIGAVADGKKGAGIGALLGAAAGGGVVLTTRGGDVSLPSGTALKVKLAEPLRL